MSPFYNQKMTRTSTVWIDVRIPPYLVNENIPFDI